MVEWTAFMDELAKRMPAEADDTLPALPGKDYIKRIYRDLRFSNDKRPYKS